MELLYSYRLPQINEFDWGYDSPREYKWPPTKLTEGFPGAHTLLLVSNEFVASTRPTWDKTWVMETSILSSTWDKLQPWRIFHPVLFLKVDPTGDPRGSKGFKVEREEEVESFSFFWFLQLEIQESFV